MVGEHFCESVGTKFFIIQPAGLGQAVGVKEQRVSLGQSELCNLVWPVYNKTDGKSCGFDRLNRSRTCNQWWAVSRVHDFHASVLIQSTARQGGVMRWYGGSQELPIDLCHQLRERYS